MSNPYEFIDKKTLEIKTNSLGYQQLVTTLTAVSQKISQQKFYEVPFADYVPVTVGQGSFMRQIIHWRTFVKGEGFKSGLISNASNKSRIDQVDAAYDEVSQNILNWAKRTEYNIFELEEAMRANSLFSLIEARELARKKEWDLGLQEVAFKGIDAETGLCNASAVTADTSTLTGWIKDLSADNFNTFVGKVYGLYRANNNYTAKPAVFVIPEFDYNGLINYPSATYPLKTKLELLLEAFKTISGNPSFKILPLAYANKGTGMVSATYNIYTLLNYDPTSVVMNVPMDYTMTTAGTVDGFTWTNVGYGQFTGVLAIRPKEMYYFKHTGALS